MKMKLTYIKDFLTSHGWTMGEVGKVFVSYHPPKGLDLPEEYYIDIPKDEVQGFQKYMTQLIEILEDLYEGRYIKTDFETFFSTNNNILG